MYLLTYLINMLMYHIQYVASLCICIMPGRGWLSGNSNYWNGKRVQCV